MDRSAGLTQHQARYIPGPLRAARPGATPSALREPPEQLDHAHVPRVGARVVLGEVRVLLRRLENQGNVAAAAIGEEPGERVTPDHPRADERVTIPVRAERT